MPAQPPAGCATVGACRVPRVLRDDLRLDPPAPRRPSPRPAARGRPGPVRDTGLPRHVDGGDRRAGGVTKPVLYQHFPSKGELYLELIETVSAELLEAVTSRATAEAVPYHRVRAGFEAYFRFVEERTSAFLLLFGGAAREDNGGAEPVRAVERSIASTIADLIDVDLEPEHRDLLGFAIVGLAEVSSRQWVRRSEAAGPGGIDGRPRLDPGEGELLARRLADLVWAGLRGLSVGPPARPAARRSSRLAAVAGTPRVRDRREPRSRRRGWTPPAGRRPPDRRRAGRGAR